MKTILILFAVSIFICCNSSNYNNSVELNSINLHKEGTTIKDRIDVPEGYHRLSTDSGSFGYFLENLKLKPDGSNVLLYSGIEKSWQNVHVAVIDMEIGKKDLQQCADACIRLRAEYLWKTKQYEKIHFNLTNGFRMDYTKWRDGNRLVVEGNNTTWSKSTAASSTYETFRAYLDKVFMYAGTLSVQKEISPVQLSEISAGDIFVVGGSPGHAVMVVDVAENENGERIFLIAQGYMPAQEIHIIKNPNDPEMSPWYSNQFTGALETMEWRFDRYTLGRF